MRIVEDDVLETHKTKELKQLLEMILGRKETVVFVTAKVKKNNFMLAQESLNFVKVVDPNSLNLMDMILHDKVIFTVESLAEFTELFLAVAFQKEKPKWLREEAVEELLNINYKEKDKEETPVFDPQVPFKPNFTFLQSYYEKYQNMLAMEEKLKEEERREIEEGEKKENGDAESKEKKEY